MPWSPKDAKKHDKDATTSKKQKQWASVANSTLKKTGDEGRAVRAASSAVKPSKKGKK